MAKLFFLFYLSFVSLYASSYYSKLEPLQTLKLSSNVSGEVVFINENRLGHKLTNKPFLKIYSKLDKEEIDSIAKKISYLESSIDFDTEILKNLEKSVQKKQINYTRVLALKIKSTLEKDKEFYDLVASKNLLLNTHKELENFKMQRVDLFLRKAQLIKRVQDKELTAEGFTLYSINVKLGEVVNVSTPLATVVDNSKGILTIYIDKEDLLTLKKSKIYINGEKTDYKVSRLLKVADTEHISKYKAQIIVDAPKIFSQLVKIEFKHE